MNRNTLTEIPHYKYVDCLRGVAIILVLIVHAMVVSNGPSYFFIGQRGVQLFYILSAFTLFLSLRERRHESKEMVNYFIRRYFRIAPLFYIALLANVIFRYLSDQKVFSLPEIFTGIFLLHGFNPDLINSIVIGGWSVAVEFSFYLVLPFIFLGIKSLKSSVILLILSMFVCGFGSYALKRIYPEYAEYFTFMWFFVQFPIFIMGIVSVFIKDWVDRNIPLSKHKKVSFFLVAAGVVFILTIPVKNKTLYLTSIFFIPVLIGLSLYQWKVVVNKFMMFVGKISYSMYLIHFFVILVVRWFLDRFDIASKFDGHNYLYFITCLMVIFLISLPVSWISWRFIESPFITLGRKLIESPLIALGRRSIYKTDTFSR